MLVILAASRLRQTALQIEASLGYMASKTLCQNGGGEMAGVRTGDQSKEKKSETETDRKRARESERGELRNGTHG